MARILLIGMLMIGAASGPALARTAHSLSMAGQAPQVWTHEPGPNDHLDRYQVLYIDDQSCPAGQIKKFTTGSKLLGVRATRECIAR